MADDSQYSQLNATEESLFVAGNYILAPVQFTLAAIILFSLFFRPKNKHDNPKAFQFAVLSIICTLICASVQISLGNDLLFHWKYDGEHQSFVSATESIFYLFYTIGKIAFYCSFTYHLLNIFDAMSTTRKYLTVWMIVACIILSGLAIAFLVDDVSEAKTKEIGVTSLHQIYLTMFVSHEGAQFAHYCAYGAAVVDMIYFIVLIHCYIKQLRKIAMNEDGEDNRHEVKGVVLLLVSCVTFWIILFVFGSGSPLALAIGAFDVISDDICLFLMFEPQSEIYQFWCKSCDRGCLRCIYGSKGYGAISDVDEVANDPHSEALL
eukprot:481191_1